LLLHNRKGISMRRLSVLRMLAASALCFVLAGTAGATVLLDETNLVALPTVAAPSEFAFTTTTAQALTVTLTDLQAPAAFQSLQIAVTLGDTVVGSVSVDATSHTAALTLPAAIGNYVLHVIGTPDATQNFGGFGACVAPTASPTSCIAADSFAGTLATPAPPSTNPASQVDTNFTSTTAGTYTVTVTDDAFPVALQRLSGGLASGSTPITQLGLGTTPVTLAAGTSYTLILGAVADATVKAGLYGVHITDPSGAAVFDRTLPVGGLGASTVVKSSSAQSLNLTLSDLQYPAALATVGAAVTAGGSPALAELTAGGSVAVAAPAGSLEVWTFASATAAPGVYSLSLASTTASLLSTTQVVNPGSDSAPGSYAFLVTLPAAGTYQLSTTDFQFPATLQSLSATIAQNGTVLTQSETGVFTAAAGTAVVLVNAQPPTTGNGIFAVTVTDDGDAGDDRPRSNSGGGRRVRHSGDHGGPSGRLQRDVDRSGVPHQFCESRGGRVAGQPDHRQDLWRRHVRVQRDIRHVCADVRRDAEHHRGAARKRQLWAVCGEHQFRRAHHHVYRQPDIDSRRRGGSAHVEHPGRDGMHGGRRERLERHRTDQRHRGRRAHRHLHVDPHLYGPAGRRPNRSP